MAEHAISTRGRLPSLSCPVAPVPVPASNAPKPSRRSVVAATAKLLAPGGAVGAAASPDNPDAGLIALCAEHAANVAAFSLYGGEVEQEDDPFWPPYECTCQAVSAARPRTMQGVLAKARAARAEAGKDERCFEGGIASDWAWDVVNDLLRLHGGA